MKTCSSCKESKEKVLFSKNRTQKDGLANNCKPCMRSINKVSRRNNTLRTRNEWLKHSYGITTEDYNKMFLVQNGCCAICITHQSELSKRLFVDHCHETGKIRGLLCSKCNTALGMLRDNAKIISNAQIYIQKSLLKEAV